MNILVPRVVVNVVEHTALIAYIPAAMYVSKQQRTIIFVRNKVHWHFYFKVFNSTRVSTRKALLLPFMWKSIGNPTSLCRMHLTKRRDTKYTQVKVVFQLANNALCQQPRLKFNTCSTYPLFI